MPNLPSQGSFTRNLYLNEKNRNYSIVKSNHIVQDSHYSMPLSHQKILASLIRSIKPGQRSLKVKFSTRQYMKMLGLYDSGDNFDRIKHDIKKVADDSFWIKQKDGSEDLFRWIDKAHADPKKKGNGDFVVQFEPQLKPYLFSQSMKYRTIYKFSDIMLMQSRYSPRLFEIFRSNQSRQKVQKRGLNYSIFELRYALNLMKRKKDTGHILHDKNGQIKFKYPAYSDFKRRVLVPAVKEINLLTAFNIKMNPVKHGGNKVVGVNVVMVRKNKKQKSKRDDIIYCITHHIPKKEWSQWREDKIKGKFHKVHNYKKNKVVDGKYKVVHHNKHVGKIKLQIPHTNQYVWMNSNQVNKSRANKTNSNNLIDKYAVQINLLGDVKIYNPLVRDYVWTNKKMATQIAKSIERTKRNKK